VLLISNLVLAQIPRDTSYTLQSTLKKHSKYYSDVSLPKVVPSKKVSVIKNTTYRILDDRKLPADLYLPKNTKKTHPGILMVHGGGWRAGNKSLMRDMSLKLAEAGYVVMAPEYRLSLEAPYPAGVYDVKAALRWMRINASSLGLDGTRIAILGCSAGGQLASLVGVTGGREVFYEDPTIDVSNEVQAIVDVDGVLKFRHPESSEGRVAAEWLGGIYEQVPENWEEASALNYVNEKTPPTLFLASKYPRFLAGHREYMQLQEQHGTLTRRVDMGDAPHSFWLLNPWFEPTVEHVLSFLNEVFDK